MVCLQETRADDDQLAGALRPALSDGWHLASAGGDLKGRNGVAVLSRHPIKAVRDRCGADEIRAARPLRGGRHRRADRRERLHPDRRGRHRPAAREGAVHGRRSRTGWRTLTDRDAVVCGDWNIAHTENDIKNWRGNVKKSGFLPAERQWLTDLLATGWVDVVRKLHPDVARAVLVVVMAGQGVRQRRRLAHRLPVGDARAGGARARRAGGAGRGVCAALVRPRSGDRRISVSGRSGESTRRNRAHRNSLG